MNSDYVAGRFKFGESISLNRSSFPGGTINTGFTGWPTPVLPPRDANGNFQVLGDGYGRDPSPTVGNGNPLAIIELIDRQSSNINIVANVYGQVDLAEGLFFRTSGNVQATTGASTIFEPTYTVSHLSNPRAQLREGRSENYTLLWENTLNYKRAIGSHSFDVLAGWTRQMDTFKGIDLRSEEFPDGISQGDAAATILPNSGGNKIITSLESYLGRLNYAFKGRYQLTASVRQDASSRLVKELRKGIFPSFSAGWVVSEEPFFPKGTFIDRLKLRGGYGELGRLNSVGAYQVQNTLSLGGSNIDYVLGRSQRFANGIALANLTNSNILWERAKATNIALESTLFDGRVTFNVEYFVKNTEDLQFDAPIPFTVGTITPSILVNAGNIQNKGFEMTLGYRKTQGEFTYNASLNLFKLDNEVISFNNPDDVFVGGQYGFSGQNATRAEVGREMSNFWLLRTNGLFQSEAEIDAHSVDGQRIQPFAKPGDLRFKDINGDGRIDADDKEFIDGSIPDLEYGLNLSANYHNFSLSMILQGVTGAKLFNGVGRSMSDITAAQTTDYWREDNRDARYFRPSISDPNGNMGDNDFYLRE